MTTISTGQRFLPVSTLGPPNPLPVFLWQQPIPLQETPPSKALSAEEVENRFVWGTSSILPYQIQDEYDRSQQPGSLPTIVIENDCLRLTLYPGLGGRLASIYDKQGQRELLFDNPAFQPANLAVLNAWFSGGIEWNGLIPGHTPFTCSPVFAAIVETEHGQILRLYEFDRIREATWQVDLFVPKNEARVWVHVKIINPNSHAVRCYWWTNMTTILQPETRVFSPADYGIEHVLPDNHLEPFEFPHAHDFDGSYPANYPYSASVFFRKSDLRYPWIAAVHTDNRGLFHTSTNELRGRKLFVFSNRPGGQHWMDFLSLPGQGKYIELQAGVMPTQDQEFVLEAGQSLEWTECLAPLELDVAIARIPDYQQACRGVEAVIKEQVSDDVLQQKDDWLRGQTDIPVHSLLHRGSAWGMLHEKLIGRTISPGLAFETTPAVEHLWAELLESGTFSKSTLRQFPTSWAVSDTWLAALEQSVTRHGATWLHEVLLGVIALDGEQIPKARKHFESSQQLCLNYLASRHLALIHQQDGDEDAAKACYLQAWNLSEQSRPLAVEICRFFQKKQLFHDLEQFIVRLPDQIARHERIQLALAEVILAKGDYDTVRTMLRHEFCSIREGEISLTDLWFTLHRKEAEARKGSPLSEEERAQAIAHNPLPYAIDFRMTNG
ncbi:MAG: DUF5107 domain-containing protein [bacterium]|nr:DUF5107 domain-containing protein [bacterium]